MKRLLDFIFAFVALLFLTPIAVLVAVVVFVDLGSPVIFRQTRPGLNGKPFVMYKFRTMKSQPSDGLLGVGDSERMTQIGRFLRSTSLDEIPQVFNVLKGDMSFVGPRPLLMDYLPLYNKRQTRRHEVRPGITGWAQINGRVNLDWQEKFEFDVWYVENQSLLLDMKIVILTIKKVVKREDVSMEENPTSVRFEGNDK